MLASCSQPIQSSYANVICEITPLAYLYFLFLKKIMLWNIRISYFFHDNTDIKRIFSTFVHIQKNNLVLINYNTHGISIYWKFIWITTFIMYFRIFAWQDSFRNLMTPCFMWIPFMKLQIFKYSNFYFQIDIE